MRRRAVLDAGTVHQHFIQDPPAKIEQLFKAIERGDIEAAVPEQVLVEVYKQVCLLRFFIRRGVIFVPVPVDRLTGPGATA